ncbi:flagellar biosynthetic protein FliP [Parvibaculum lavamentivorans DS-1]|uniref:Flagellar biosynthetic protein FliP n=1 Tax=Parvibaculum lavamentivorans (strain DS-1 / DSM 13023 / NCIMB 13966) TaxID=402881 RepID=A7HW94_PARL1|nr:flagellar biosynthetic protein FliP [Parvibaculum lavamentivorans DS-1]
MIRTLCKFLPALALVLLSFGVAQPAFAQAIQVDLSDNLGLTDHIVQIVALVTVLSLAPSILIMVTSFVRIIVVLSLLRTALGMQQSPPNAVLVSLALFLTAFVMTPTFTTAYNEGIEPLMNQQIETAEAFERSSVPFKTFMLSQVRKQDLQLFVDLSQTEQPEEATDIGLQVIVPAFMISELRRAFEIGFLVFLPFIVIDMVVASVLMSMGMMMLPPVIISLPFKLIFFVLVDGWSLIAGSLVQSFGT